MRRLIPGAALAAGILGLALLSACVPRATSMRIPIPDDLEKSAAVAGSNTATAAGNPRLQPPDEDKPVQITSDRLEYRNQGQVTVFRGRVKVNQTASRLSTPYLEVRSDDGLALARDGIELVDYERGLTVTAQEMTYRKNLSHIIARQKVRLRSRDEQGVPLSVRSQRLEWWSDRREALASGEVVFHYKDITATADTMHYRQADQILILKQDGPSAQDKAPEIRQGTDVLRGEIITIQIQNRKYEAQGAAQALIISSPEKGSFNPSGKE